MKYRWCFLVAFLFVGVTILLNVFSLRSIEKESIKDLPELVESAWGKYHLVGVDKFGPLKIGDQAPDGPGDATTLPQREIPKSKFYITVHRMGLPIFCSRDSCAFLEGLIIDCMGGWIAGDDQPESAHQLGLNSEEVWRGKASMVVLSDENAKIIGIYPNHVESDILAILFQFPEYRVSLQNCVDEIIGLSPYEPKSFDLPTALPVLSGGQIQAMWEKAKKTAVLMPDNSIQDVRGQMIFQIHYEYDKQAFFLYRYPLSTNEIQPESGFRTKMEALDFAKKSLEERGYTIVAF